MLATSSRELPLGLNDVVLVFACNELFVPYLSVALQSILVNTSPERHYDIVVLTRDITPKSMITLTQQASKYGVGLGFLDVDAALGDIKLPHHGHFRPETYFRLLAPTLLDNVEKAIYLDSDIVVCADVAELYDTDVAGCLLAATRDADTIGQIDGYDPTVYSYLKDQLGMTEPHDYFQAGVLVLNTQEMRRLHTVSEWLRIATRPDFIYNDQDILNAECEGRVTYLPGRWNVTNNIFGRVDKLYPWAPSQVFDDYQAGRADPQVVHYAGAIKPWQNASIDLGGYFWNYARQTPFYEQILQSMVPEQNKDDDVVEYHERAIPDTSPLRKVIDPFLPYGSERRERAKAIARAIQGKK